MVNISNVSVYCFLSVVAQCAVRLSLDQVLRLLRLDRTLEMNDPREKIEHFIIKADPFYRDDPITSSFYATAIHESHFVLSPKTQQN